MKRLIPLLLLIPIVGISQDVTINSVELAGDNVIVHYNLESPNQASTFLLNLYASKDNFSVPLTKVSGDVGPEVKPGAGNKITWNMRQEFGNYKGRIALEIRGRVYVPFVKLQNFTTSNSYKRGKIYDLLWKSGGTDPINIELFKGDQRVQAGMSHPNNGSFSLNIPSSAKPGKDYHLKITNTRNNDETIVTPNFKVTPKVPLLVKVIIPLAVVGGAAAVLGGGAKKDSGGSSGTNTSTDLPNPSFPSN